MLRWPLAARGCSAPPATGGGQRWRHPRSGLTAGKEPAPRTPPPPPPPAARRRRRVCVCAPRAPLWGSCVRRAGGARARRHLFSLSLFSQVHTAHSTVEKNEDDPAGALFHRVFDSVACPAKDGGGVASSTSALRGYLIPLGTPAHAHPLHLASLISSARARRRWPRPRSAARRRTPRARARCVSLPGFALRGCCVDLYFGRHFPLPFLPARRAPYCTHPSPLASVLSAASARRRRWPLAARQWRRQLRRT